MPSTLEKYITIVVIDCGYRFYHQEVPRPLETRFDPGYYDNLVRPSEVEADLAQVEKETQVYLCWIT